MSEKLGKLSTMNKKKREKNTTIAEFDGGQ